MRKKDLWVGFVLRSVAMGTASGIVLGSVFPLFFFQLFTNLAAGLLLYAPFGLGCGLVAGSLIGLFNGMLLGAATLIFFSNRENKMSYRLTMGVLAVFLTSIFGFIVLYVIAYEVLTHNDEGARNLAFPATVLAAVAGTYASQKLAAWYLNLPNEASSSGQPTGQPTPIQTD